MKEKSFHRGRYEGTASIESCSECTECKADSVIVMSFIAEHNAGELYTVDVCEACLVEALTEVRNAKGRR